MSAVAAEIVAKIRDLPPLPSVVVRMHELLTDANTTAREIERLLASEPAIASKVLCIANSAYYGVGQRVGTLSHAVMVLGFNTVRNVVFASSLMRSLDACAAEGSYDPFRFWQHSIATGAACKLLARRLQLPHQEEYFLVGLLHDLGKVVLAGWVPVEEAERVRALTAEGEDEHAAERAVLGTDHAEVGAELLARWRLPIFHVEAVRHHHTPALSKERRASQVIHVADALTHALLLGVGERDSFPRLGEEAWAGVGPPPAELPQFFRDVFGLLAQAETVLNPRSRRRRSRFTIRRPRRT
ncbi:MAG: HDOD domain-containing protein [Planctomycetota bacterium]|nr:MAG: HDOD domain-containing protein [Planctomycetota bacterium]